MQIEIPEKLKSTSLSGQPLMDLKQKQQSRLFEEMKSNLPLRLLHLAPRFSELEQTLEVYSKFCGLPLDEVVDAVDRLLNSGLWIQVENGQILLSNDYSIRLGQTRVDDHLSSTLALINQLSPDGPCWYESLVFATTQDLKKEFYQSVYKAMQELISKSQTVKSDCLIAWSHQGFDFMKQHQGQQNKTTHTKRTAQ